ncbi:MAG: 3-demethylubiquinone-9 3-methyltransferase [Acetobacter aceti]|uniref:3-demethylubiquinone-9 3-methyltransferase n=1 Tax=Acetobacter aceti TaxID=435 RepID=A0A1U9KKJ5_ACEAC|nr:3-demethylubiquinone-9 3-methyltransferase [Acetobacter aceti]AQS86266.1 3-demethylubiquinone-9 3-methyltransferase [Acetobacter aceti]
MNRETTRRTIFTLSALAVMGLGSAGWIWIHREANHELIEALENAKAHLPPGVEFTWSKAIALPTSHGARLTDVVLKDPNGTISAATIELIGAVAGSGETKSTPDHSSLHFDHVIAYTLQVTGADGTMQVKRLSLDGIMLPPSTEDQVSSLMMDHGEATQVAVTSVDGLESARADHVILDQYGTGRISRLTVSKFLLHYGEHPVRDASIAQLVSDGSDLAGLLQSYLKGNGLLFHDGNQSFTVEDFLLSGEVDGPGSAQDRLVGFEKGRLHIDTDGKKSRVTESFTHFRVWPTGPRSMAIKTLGYQKFDGAVVLNAIVDREADVAHVTQFDVNAPEFGHLNMAGDFVQLAAPQGALPQPQIAHLDFSWRDDGLVSRIINSMAVAQGMDPDAYVTLLRRTWSPAGAAPDSVGAQLAKYIANPEAGPLTAMIAPEKPVPVLTLVTIPAMMTHPQVVEMLGLTVQSPVAGAAAGDDAQAPDPNMTTDEPVDPEVLAPGPSAAPKTGVTAQPSGQK